MAKAPRRVQTPAVLRPGASGRAIYLAVAGSLLAMWTPLADVYGLPKLLALCAGVASAWACLLGGPERGLQRRSGLEFPLALAAAALLASWAGSSDRFVGLYGKYSLYTYGLLGFALCALLHFGVSWSSEPDDPDRLLAMSAWCGAVAGGYALLQRAGIEPLAGVRAAAPAGRALSTLGDPVPLGACLVAVFPAAVRLARRGGLGLAAAALILGGLWASGSRGAWLGAAAGLGSYAWAAGFRPGWGRRGWALALACAALLAVAGAWALQARGGAAASDVARIELWRSLAGAWRERPWLGFGPDTIQTVLRAHRTQGFVRVLGTRGSQVSAHNDLLQFLVTTGAVGLAAYLWLLLAALRVVLRALSDETRREAAAVVLGAAAGLFVQAKVNPIPLPAAALTAAYLGLLAGPRAPRSAAAGVAAAAFLALGGVGLLAALRLASADLHFQRARASSASRPERALAEYRAAIRRNPGELHYRLDAARYLYALVERSPGRRAAFLEEAVSLGREAIRLRPADPDGHALLGTFLLAQAGGGDREALSGAAHALETASALDPFHLPILENRLRTAQLLGDAEAASRLSSRVQALQQINSSR